jgi:glycosyltransferase involved in cell wall biosynthesis
VSELGIAADRIDVIAYGLGACAATSPLPESELRERHGLAERPVVLAVASDLPHKNLGALIDAAEQIPAQRRPVIVIAGPGTDGQRLRDRVHAAGLEGDVRLLGFVAADELEGLYAIATCVVLPSLYEGFGLPVLEAMSRGIPVACSDIPAMRAAAGDAALGFAPDRPQDIAGSLERLIGDAALRSRLAEAGRARASLFSWTTAAEQTLQCYRRALAAG